MNKQNKQAEEEVHETKFPSVTRDALLLDDNGVTFRQFLNDFAAMAKYLEMGRTLFAEFLNLTPSQYSMVMLIAEAHSDGGVSPGSISEKLQQQNTFVIAQLRKLSKEGLIASSPNPNDKRSILYRLTERGVELIGNSRPLVQLVNDAFFNSLTREEFEMLSSTLRKLTESKDTSLEDIRLLALRKGIEMHDGKIRVVTRD